MKFLEIKDLRLKSPVYKMSVKVGFIDTCRSSKCSRVLGEGKSHEEVKKKREGKFAACSGCGVARYCSCACLYEDSTEHKKTCKPLTLAMKRVTVAADAIQSSPELLKFIKNICVEEIGDDDSKSLLISVDDSFNSPPVDEKDEIGKLKEPFPFSTSTYPFELQGDPLLGVVKNFELTKKIKYIVIVTHKEAQPKIPDENSIQVFMIDR